MQYKYTENEDFSFLSSGNVIKHFKGMPCFPVRLSLELFETAFERIGKDKIMVYDPCCGNGFSLTVLGMMKQDKISHLYGSDVEESCAEAALCNLSMITEEGIAAARDRVLSNPETTEASREQITSSVEKILPYLSSPPDSRVFVHDILRGSPDISEPADYVFADIPYGIMTEWKSDGEVNAPLEAMLANLNSIMQAGGILTVCGGKDLRLNAEGFRRVGKLRAGKRLIIILEKV